MDQRKFGIYIGLLLIVTIGTVFFIRLSNDHKECEDVTTKIIRGNTEVITKKHICREKYSF